MELDQALEAAEAERVMRWMVGNYKAHEYAAVHVEDGELSFVWRKFDDPGADAPVLLESDQVKVSVEEVLKATPAVSPKRSVKKPAKKAAKK